MKYSKLEILIGAFKRPDLVIRYLKGKQPSEFDIDEVARYVSGVDPVIVEAGAFDGKDTLSFSCLWPEGHVYAFEPLPHLAKMVRVRTSNRENVTLIEKALGVDERDSVLLHSANPDTQIHGSSSLLEPGDHLDLAPQIIFDSVIEVAAVTLDTWHKSIGSPNVDLLWLDLQGAELLVLKQGEELLQRTSVCHIEVTKRSLYEGGASFDEVREFFHTRGFRMVACRIPVRSGNAIFCRK
jgi:FkbM family methyltransferase